ncbi:hypothetical protein [Enterobacter kobei]|uniref:hypothetical protein n=1 Tax=Enterobacter kobei TaxID=208224 RepID=UPI00254C3589|nr:hypothetical protein [Enterobacter kobei]MDK9981213.1 hypothetical protein [Enterobacter kobei]
MARSINWRRSSRLSPFPLSISEWQVTQIPALAWQSDTEEHHPSLLWTQAIRLHQSQI